jgi:hypothetical protein
MKSDFAGFCFLVVVLAFSLTSIGLRSSLDSCHEALAAASVQNAGIDEDQCLEVTDQACEGTLERSF